MINLETLKVKAYSLLKKSTRQIYMYVKSQSKKLLLKAYVYLKKIVKNVYHTIGKKYTKDNLMRTRGRTVETQNKIFKFKLETKNVNQEPIVHYPITTESKEGDTVSLVNAKKKVKLGSLIGAKGEGSVYHLGKYHVAKIFYQDKFTSNKLMKIDLLIKGASQDKKIAYPVDFLLNSKKEIVGYVMPKASGMPLQRLFSISEIQQNFPKWRLSHLLQLSWSLTSAVKKIHQQNLIIGDLNGGNILVENEYNVTVIDTDSFQVNDYPSDVGMVEYTREIHMDSLEGSGFKKLLKSKYDDLNALSIVIFQILHTGQLPYNHVNGEESYIDNIKKGFFPYECSGQSSSSVPDASRKQWAMTPKPLKEYFCKVFKEKALVGMSDLEKALSEALKSMRK